MVLAMADMVMESELLMLILFMGIMATLLLAMVMVLAMADMVMESELLMLILFTGIMATLLLAMVMVLAMADMVMESEKFYVRIMISVSLQSYYYKISIL